MKFSLEWLDDLRGRRRRRRRRRACARCSTRPGFPSSRPQLAGSDTILDVEITPNRPDAMGHRGLAREIAAMAGLARRDDVRDARRRRVLRRVDRAARRPS